LRARLHAQARAASFDLIAEDEESGRAVGWRSVEVLPFRRARHTGHLVIGVDKAAAGRGIGRGLLAAAEREASGRELRRRANGDNRQPAPSACICAVASGWRGCATARWCATARRSTSITWESSYPTRTAPDLDRLSIPPGSSSGATLDR
jgi:L-amino acid N-acyltransferase YncA